MRRRSRRFLGGNVVKEPKRRTGKKMKKKENIDNIFNRIALSDLEHFFIVVVVIMRV